MKTIKITFLVIFTLIVSINVNAQWTTDTDVNTLVVDSEGGDMKAVGTSDGQTYIVFWKSVEAPINYELRVQLLDANGDQQLGDDGILISNTIPMSTFTAIWFVTIDSDNNLYVGVTGTEDETGLAYKIDTSGDVLWTVSNPSTQLVKVLPMSSGDAIVAWLSTSSYKVTMQKYDSNGDPIWPSNQTTADAGTAPANLYELSTGDYIVVFHQLLTGINSNLYAQRFDGDGNAVWADRVQLSDKATAFNAIYDGTQDGDVVYMGYMASSAVRFDSYLQRINPDGNLPWGINGSDFDTNETDYEMGTLISFEEGSQNVWAICTYRDSNQSESGEYVQKFDKDTGARLLTENAKEIYPIGSEKVHAGSLQLKNDAPLLLLKSGVDNGASPTTLGVVLLDGNGDILLSEDDLPAATFSANKSRIQYTKPVNNQSVVVFIEDKGDGEKIYAQNIVDEELSINDFENENAIFYVNPVSEIWNLKSENTISSISIYNVLGQSIFELANDSSKVVSINTENWNSGMYILKITTEVGVVSKQIIKN